MSSRPGPCAAEATDQSLRLAGLRTKLTIDEIVAVIDAAAVAEGRFADDPERVAEQRRSDPSLDHDNPLEEVYEDQLMSADLVVLNKTDLIGADAN